MCQGAADRTRLCLPQILCQNARLFLQKKLVHALIFCRRLRRPGRCPLPCFCGAGILFLQQKLPVFFRKQPAGAFPHRTLIILLRRLVRLLCLLFPLYCLSHALIHRKLFPDAEHFLRVGFRRIGALRLKRIKVLLLPVMCFLFLRDKALHPLHRLVGLPPLIQTLIAAQFLHMHPLRTYCRLQLFFPARFHGLFFLQLLYLLFTGS